MIGLLPTQRRLDYETPFQDFAFPLICHCCCFAVLWWATDRDGYRTVTGIVLDSDGKTPLAGATVQIDSLVKLSDGRMALRERVLIKTLRDGRYRYSEVRPGRIRITIIVNNKPVMSYGGDDILVVEGGETVADFDLSKAPPAQ